MQPDSYTVTRTVNIAATAEQIFPLINDFRKWDNWSPWAKLDPKMVATHSGPPTGPGASYHWIGNEDVGEGRMTITGSDPSSKVVVDLNFIKPFESNAVCTFQLSPVASGGGTNVSWSMSGKSNFMSKAMMLFASMDSMIGSDFEKGLRQMKTLAESAR
ncbi:potassium-transporting ATPase subunit F [Bryobacterales bacterium F-183]|nr:potassium-transporting ATPase subunit F [Bryobacterales bacterium F-183]